jgi:hypothetical protein
VGKREDASDDYRQDGPDLEPVVAVVGHASTPFVRGVSS